MKPSEKRGSNVPGFEDVDEGTLARQLARMRPIYYSDYLRFLSIPIFPFHGGDPAPPSREEERDAERKALDERVEELRERCDDALKPTTVH